MKLSPAGDAVAFRRFAVTLVLFAGLTVLASCDKAATAPAASLPDVSIVPAHASDVEVLDTAPARVNAFRIAEIRPQVSGVILKRMFEEGADVHAGQQLYQIDPSLYQAALDRAQGTLQQLQAALVTAQARARRYESLSRMNAVSHQDYDDAVATEREAEANIAAAKAGVDTAQINLTYTRVLSPITGRIGRSTVTEGALVTSDQAMPLSVVTQLDPIYADLTETSIALLHLRRSLAADRVSRQSSDAGLVDLTLEDDTRYSLRGKLQFSEVTVDPGTGMTTLRTEFPNPDHTLLPGMFVHATVLEGKQRAWMVPQNVVSRDIHDDPFVLVVGNDDVVSRRSITIARGDDTNWVVTGGLTDGDRIVVDGLQQAVPGTRVHPHAVAAMTASAR
ncbi:MAG: rane fusion protein multidrug efflux system [Acetobacteraceae bacterium]|jgi:membrane fusion protein (multidrug efflux system)|nr:rane fusion protein multidrug efflux system [Acetobacteraceae bacterium]